MIHLNRPMEPQGRRAARYVAWLSIGSAVLFMSAIQMPFVGVDGAGDSLGLLGAPMKALFLLGPITVLVAATVALRRSLHLAWAAAGAAWAIMGPAMWILGTGLKWTTEANREFARDLVDAEAGLQSGAVLNIMAMLLAASAGVIAAANHEIWDEGNGIEPPRGRVFLAATFLLMPISILTEQEGWSVWDIRSGAVQFSALVWGLVPAGLAAWISLQGRLKGVIFAIGMATGNLIVAIGMDLKIADPNAIGEVQRSPYEVPGVAGFRLGAILGLGFGALCLSQMGVLPRFGSRADRASEPSLGVVSAGRTVSGGPTDGAKWAADPFGRFEYRYYDGGAWTAIVSSGGVVSNDPPIPPPPA